MSESYTDDTTQAKPARPPPRQLAGNLEEHVLALLCHSDHATDAAEKLTPDLFTTRQFRIMAQAALDYVRRYRIAPREHLADILEREIEKGDLGKQIWQQIGRLDPIAASQNPRYVLDQLDEFVLHHRRRLFLTDALKANEKGDVAEQDAAVRQFTELAGGDYRLKPLDLGLLRAPPPRQWVYGRLAPRGKASAVAGDGGTGKSNWAVGAACAIATGTMLLGEPVYRPGVAVYIGLEDELEDHYRTLAAYQRHHKLNETELAARLIISSDKLLVALKRGQRVQRSPHVSRLVRELQRLKAVAVFVDALSLTHELDDENSNMLMTQLLAIWNAVAREAKVVVCLLHHVSKAPGVIGVDRARGAIAIKNHTRSLSMLDNMTPDEAKGLYLGDDEREEIIGLAPVGKYNFMRNPKTTTWFRKVSVNLDNGDPRSVFCLEAYQPHPLESLDPEVQQAILAKIAQGCGEGEFYAQAKQSGDRWVIHLFAQHEVTEQKALGHLADWLKRGLIFEDEYRSPRTRRMVKRLQVSEETGSY